MFYWQHAWNRSRARAMLRKAPRNAGLTKTAHCVWQEKSRQTNGPWLPDGTQRAWQEKQYHTEGIWSQNSTQCMWQTKSDTEPKQLDHKTALSWRGKKSGAKQGNLKMSSLPWCVPQHAAEAQRSRAGVDRYSWAWARFRKKQQPKRSLPRG